MIRKAHMQRLVIKDVLMHSPEGHIMRMDSMYVF
jgi:hypothetical protein